jgi:hypothetical protein
MRLVPVEVVVVHLSNPRLGRRQPLFPEHHIVIISKRAAAPMPSRRVRGEVRLWCGRGGMHWGRGGAFGLYFLFFVFFVVGKLQARNQGCV